MGINSEARVNRDIQKDDLFRKHLDLNNKLKSSLIRIIKYIKKIHTLDDIEKKELNGFIENHIFKRFSSEWKKDFEHLELIFDSLEYEHKEILKLLEGESGLIQIIEKENIDITNFLSLKSSNPVERNLLIERLIGTYNAQKQRHWEILRNLFGQKAKFESNLIDRLEKNIEDMVLEYCTAFNNLKKLVLTEDNKNSMKWDAIYHSIYNIVQELSLFSDNNFKDTFLNTVDKKVKDLYPNFKVKENIFSIFAKNFFSSPKTFSNYFRVYNEEYKTYEIYSHLPEEQKKQIDKLLAESLALLFKGIKTVENVLKQKIEEEDKDFDNLKKAYLLAYEQLADKLRVEGKFYGKLEDCIISGEDGIEDGTSFKSFQDDKLQKGKANHNYIKRVTNYLRTVAGNKNAFNKFKYVNRSHFNEDLGEESSDDNKIWGSSNEIKENDIQDAFEELFKEIKSNVSLISNIIREPNNFENDKLKDDVRRNIDEAFADIIDKLKIIGKNLKKYRSIIKTQWSDQILNNNLNELEATIKLINSDRSKSENIIFSVNKILHVLDSLR